MAFLDDIKDRLGFGKTDDDDDAEDYGEFDEELYGQDFDPYAEDFDEHGSDAGSEGGYSAFAPITTRESGSGRRSRSTSEGRSRSSHPALVSIDDVRNSTRVPESLNRDPLPPRRNDTGRESVGHANNYIISGAPDKEETPAPGSTGAIPKPASQVGMGTHPAGGSYDPYQAYEAGYSSSHRPTRSISVISPTAYGEVENVARMLRAGDAVVLSLRNTPNQLSKRILDFSFGVASALDATVDCIADKVFAITRISNLTEDELARLRAQGVI